MLEIAGSLWSVAPDEHLDSAKRLKAAGLTRLHWDMTDGRFAAAGGFTARQAREIAAATGLSAEAHIMAERSISEVDEWTEFCDLVIIHAESSDWMPTLDRIRQRGCRAGLAISPLTTVDVVPDDVPVLCMSVIPGRAGTTFDESVLIKVAALRERSHTRTIGIDGGVRRHHAKAAADAGADWVVVGSDLFLDHGERRWSELLGTSRA